MIDRRRALIAAWGAPVTLVPTQLGRGTPSPENYRAIRPNHIVLPVGPDIFDEDAAEWVDGKRIQANGSTINDRDYRYSGHFFEIAPGKSYKITFIKESSASSGAAVAFYASDESFLSRAVILNSTTETGEFGGTFTTPDGCAYFRVSIGRYSNDIEVREIHDPEEIYVYAGEIDLPSGTITATHAYLEMDGATSGKAFTNKGGGANNNFYLALSDADTLDAATSTWVSAATLTGNGILASNMEVSNPNTHTGAVPFFCAYIGSAGVFQPRVQFGPDSEITTVELANQQLADWYAAGKPFGFVYKLKTPVVYTIREVTA